MSLELKSWIAFEVTYHTPLNSKDQGSVTCNEVCPRSVNNVTFYMVLEVRICMLRLTNRS